MGPEVVRNSQVKKKNPEDAVVAWENKQPPRQLERTAAIGGQVRNRLLDFTAASGRSAGRVLRLVGGVGGVNTICRVVGCHSNGSWETMYGSGQFWRARSSMTAAFVRKIRSEGTLATRLATVSAVCERITAQIKRTQARLNGGGLTVAWDCFFFNYYLLSRMEEERRRSCASLP